MSTGSSLIAVRTPFSSASVRWGGVLTAYTKIPQMNEDFASAIVAALPGQRAYQQRQDKRPTRCLDVA